LQSAFSLILAFLFIIPLGVRRAIRVGWESQSMAHRPDRKLLTGWILPEFSKPGVTLLWVGCQPYTQPYLDTIERRGAKCWTLEIEPSALWWGHPDCHTTGDVQNVGLLYEKHKFDVTLVNGVFGYGLNSRNGQDKAIAGIAHIFKPGGLLMLGWNTHRTADPLQLQALEQFFRRPKRPGVDHRITFP
jgi:hypothetical protein